jgi:threonine/homoserine/homoserine lactone efflux protein
MEGLAPLFKQYSGFATAVLGFAGALVLWWASWRSIKTRKAIIEGAQVSRSRDPKLAAEGKYAVDELNDEQLKLLAGERRLFFWGAILLVPTFLRR